MLETGAPPNAREKRLSQGSHLPREKGGLTGPLHCLCFWWIYGERAGNRALHHPRGGEKNLKFVFLFCFYHQSPMRATKISHKNTCLLEQRPKLPRRSTIYLNHTAGLEDGVSPPPQRNKGTWHQQLFTSASGTATTETVWRIVFLCLENWSQGEELVFCFYTIYVTDLCPVRLPPRQYRPAHCSHSSR